MNGYPDDDFDPRDGMGVIAWCFAAVVIVAVALATWKLLHAPAVAAALRGG
jgi:hypothetical protein